jgi:hypothetical protein
MAFASFGTESQARRKKVYYEGTDTIYEGMALCYNQDTTNNILGWDAGNSVKGSTTAEGYQNEGKFLRVEKPATANMVFFAGVVAGSDYAGLAGPRWLDVYVPNGAIVPVRTSSNCVIGQAVGLANASYVMEPVTGDGDPAAVAILMETVDRSSTNGLALAKLCPTGQAVLATSALFAPVRYGVAGYAYGVNISGTSLLTGTAASKSYVVNISGSRESAAATGDSNDAMLKVSGSNYGACDTNFIFRGINVAMSNRDGGTLGRMDNNISISLKQGSTCAYAVGLSVDAQDLAASAKTEFGGLDVALNREGLAATLEYGLQIRTRGTINSAMTQAIYVRKDATDYGFAALLGLDAAASVGGYASTGNAPALATGDIMIPVVIDGTTYYLVALQDTGV